MTAPDDSMQQSQMPDTPTSARLLMDVLDQAEQQLLAGHRMTAVALAQQAATQAEAGIALPGLLAQILARAGEVLGNAGEDAAAIHAGQHALRAVPDHAFATYVVARALQHLGQFADAEALLDSGLGRHPDDMDLLRLKADLLTTHGAFAEAVAHLRHVTQQAPRDEVAWFNLSNALLTLRDYPEALAAAEQAIVLAAPPQVAGAWVNKGRALTGLGDYQRAVAVFQEAVRINRAQLQAHYWLADLYGKQGQRLRALQEQVYWRFLSLLYRAQYHVEQRLNRGQLDVLGMTGDARRPQRSHQPSSNTGDETMK